MTLRAEAIRLWRGRRPVLRAVSLALAPGELLAVVGPNGAGKSSLLRCLAGEWTPQAGQVTLRGRPLSDWSPLALAGQRAVLPQSSALEFPFTVREVAAFGLTVAGHSRARHAQWLDTALTLADVAHLAGRAYPTLSGGERQRTQLARVLCQALAGAGPAHCLLLDEPTAAQDLRHQHGLLAMLRAQAARRGWAVVVVLHDLNLAARYADRVAVLDRGRLAALDRPAAALSAERVSRVFGLPVRSVVPPGSDRPCILPAGEVPAGPVTEETPLP